MKPLPLLVAFMALVSPVRSQDQAKAISGGSTAMPVPTPSTTARIIGNIPDGTPPPPQVPKPQFVARATDILDTKVHQQGGRTITIQKIKPIALSSPPDPAPQSLAAADPAFQERLAEFRQAHPNSGMLTLGATVYRFTDSPPRTLVTYRPVGRGECITFWSSADFALIAGIYSFVATDGAPHRMFMMWSRLGNNHDYIEKVACVVYSGIPSLMLGLGHVFCQVTPASQRISRVERCPFRWSSQLPGCAGASLRSMRSANGVMEYSIAHEIGHEPMPHAWVLVFNLNGEMESVHRAAFTTDYTDFN